MLPSAPVPRPALVALSLCFLFSGLASLVLEVVWLRELRLVFGSTTLATSTVLVAYMLGLGLGALAGGRLGGRIRNAVRAYGQLEIAIGLCALFVPLLLGQFPVLNRALLYRLAFWPAALCRFALALAVLALPTLLMGATLPVLTGAVVGERAGAGRLVGLLYGLNTLGAVGGVLLATFVLFPGVGLDGANAIGAGIDIAVGVLTLAVVTRWRPAPPARPARRAAPPLPRRWHPLLPAYALVGFTALVFEVGWTRALGMVLGSSVYAFACMLAAFLAGIGLGSLAARRSIDRLRRPLVAAGVAIGALGVLSLVTTLALPHLPDLFVRAVVSFGTGRLPLLHFGFGVLAMLPPALVLGALFPLVARALADERVTASMAVGDVYFANTVGSAVGAFIAGFVLIPLLGLRATLALASAIDLAAAGLLALAGTAGTGYRRVLGGVLPLAAAAALVVVPFPWNARELTRGVFRSTLALLDVGVKLLPIEGVPYNELVFYRDGLNSTVSVHRENNSVFLKINGKTDATVPGDMSTQALLAHIPLLFGPPAARALVIGLASGVTVGTAARYPLERIDTVEIEPAVVEASHFFDDYNGRPMEDARVRVIVDDGRTYLSGTAERYDVIISEPPNPWVTGAADLFTREFFHLARGALRPRGRLLQWLQLYGLEPTGFRAILAAMRAEFPSVYVFSWEPGYGDVLVLAAAEPLRREDIPHWERLPPAVREDLERFRHFSTLDLWSLVRLLPADVDRLVRDAPVVNSDQNLFVELSSPRLLHAEQQTLDVNWALLRPFDQGVLPLLQALGEPLDADRIGALALSYIQAHADHDVAAALARESTARGRSAHGIATAVMLAAGSSRERLLAQLDEAVALAPDALEPRLLRATHRMEAGRNSETLEDIEAAVALAPEDPRPRTLRWQVLRRLGQLDEAAAQLDAVAGLPYVQAQPALWLGAADVYFAVGRLEDGIAWLRRVLRGRPLWAEGWELLANASERAGRAEEAGQARRNASQARRDQVLLLQRDARLAAARHDWARAVDLARQAIAKDASYEPVVRDLERFREGQRRGY